jgi:hypothetical protein
MNWLTVTVLAAVAGWFEYNYQRSRRNKASAKADPISQAANVEEPGDAPSIAPGSENDKKLNTAV